MEKGRGKSGLLAGCSTKGTLYQKTDLTLCAGIWSSLGRGCDVPKKPKKGPTKKKNWMVKCDNCPQILRLGFQGPCPNCGCETGTYLRA